ncbi:metallophosphoesterase family protein [Candidatus Peribacteria bacterium]|nr:metallophosphoesterase family protein [Candidatus Peribacteria bacterium]
MIWLAKGIMGWSWLLVPAIVLLLYWWGRAPRRWWRHLLYGLGVGVLLLGSYMRFIEPQIITVAEHPLSLPGFTPSRPVRLALLSDLHLGAYKSPAFLRRVVETLQQQAVDAVLIAGDFTHAITEEQLPEYFAPLQALTMPVYAVLGNHDLPSSSGFTGVEVAQALRSVGVQVIDEQARELSLGGENLTLIGLGDESYYPVNTALATSTPPEESVIALSHSPDIAYQLPQGHTLDLLLSGHTHGGQVRIPPFYHWMIPSAYGFDHGSYTIDGLPLFITTGLGEMALPIRLGVPPVIDLFTLSTHNN